MNAPANPARKLGRIWWIVFAVGFVGLIGRSSVSSCAAAGR